MHSDNCRSLSFGSPARPHTVATLFSLFLSPSLHACSLCFFALIKSKALRLLAKKKKINTKWFFVPMYYVSFIFTKTVLDSLNCYLFHLIGTTKKNKNLSHLFKFLYIGQKKRGHGLTIKQVESHLGIHMENKKVVVPVLQVITNFYSSSPSPTTDVSFYGVNVGRLFRHGRHLVHHWLNLT